MSQSAGLTHKAAADVNIVFTVTNTTPQVGITCADQNIQIGGEDVNLSTIATFSTGYAGSVTYALKTTEPAYTHASVTPEGVVSIDNEATANDTFTVIITAADDNTNNFTGATKEVTFTVISATISEP